MTWAATILDAADYYAAADQLDEIADILAVIADQRDDLLHRIGYAQLCFDLVGEVEFDQLAAEVEQFKRVCKCLAWRPA